MSSRTALWVREHQLVTYFVLAYAISWIIVAPLIASAQGFIDIPVPFALHYLNDYGPLLGALITAGIASGTEGLRGSLAGRVSPRPRDDRADGRLRSDDREHQGRFRSR